MPLQGRLHSHRPWDGHPGSAQHSAPGSSAVEQRTSFPEPLVKQEQRPLELLQ